MAYLGGFVALLEEQRAHRHEGIVRLPELRGGGGALPQRVLVRSLHHGRHVLVAPQRLLAVRQQVVEPRVDATELFAFVLLCFVWCVLAGRCGQHGLFGKSFLAIFGNVLAKF
jgi:hypothetical protein